MFAPIPRSPSRRIFIPIRRLTCVRDFCYSNSSTKYQILSTIFLQIPNSHKIWASIVSDWNCLISDHICNVSCLHTSESEMCSCQSGSNLSPLGHAVTGKVGTLGNGKVYHADRRIAFNMMEGDWPVTTSIVQGILCSVRMLSFTSVQHRAYTQYLPVPEVRNLRSRAA